MAAFKFSLEPLLVQRRAIELEKLHAFANAQQRLNRTRCERDVLEQELAEHAQRGVSAGFLAHFERSLAALQMREARERAQVEEAQTDLLPVMRDREALEALKHRRLAEHAAREARKEERELDEANNR